MVQQKAQFHWGAVFHKWKSTIIPLKHGKMTSYTPAAAWRISDSCKTQNLAFKFVPISDWRKMLRSILRAAAAAASRHQPYNRNPSPILSFTSNYSAKATKSAVKKAPKKGKSKGDGKATDDPSASAAASDDLDAALFDDKSRARRLAAEENDHSLDVGPNGRPLFTSASSLSQLTRKDAGTYFKFKYVCFLHCL